MHHLGPREHGQEAGGEHLQVGGPGHARGHGQWADWAVLRHVTLTSPGIWLGAAGSAPQKRGLRWGGRSARSLGAELER